MNQETNREWALVGERIRSARLSRGVSMRELARRIDVSPSHVSQVERGLGSFSVRSLYTVAGVLGVSMDSLFAPEDDETLTTSTSSALIGPEGREPEAVADPPIVYASDSPLDKAGIVQRVGQRPSITLESGPRWERLTPRPEASSEFIEVVYAARHPGAEPPTGFVRHDGREYGVIIKGSLTVQVGFESTVLAEGDAIAFDSSVPHRFWNATAEEVRAIWFVLDRQADAPGDADGTSAPFVSTRHPH